MSPIRMSRVESSMRIALDYYEGIRKNDADVILQLIGDDCTFETSEPAPDGTMYSGKDAIARYIEEFLEMSSQSRFEIEDIYGAGKRSIVFWRYVDDRKEEKNDGIRGIDIFWVKDGLIQELISYVKGSWLLT